MADVLIANLPAGTAAGTDELPVNQAGTTRKITVSGANAVHEALADPHTGYRLESADHSHQSAGLQAGQLNATSVFSTGTVPTAHLGSGTADATTILAGDQSYKRRQLANANTADVVASAVDTYLTGSNLNLAGNIKAGTIIEFNFVMTKTAAGTAAPVWNVRFGTNGTTADTTRFTMTGSAQTAATDTGFCRILVVIRNAGATGIVHTSAYFTHDNTTTGLRNVAQNDIVRSTSVAFDLTVANLQVGVSCNPGTSGVWTFQHVSARADNLL